MGQYYKATNIDTKESIRPHSYDNGAKLMESSYIGNNYVEQVCALLCPDGIWYKSPIVWAGDYMDSGIFGVEAEETLYDVSKEITPHNKYDKSYNIVVNHTKKMYTILPEEKKDEWQIHPLPLLTCSGNGRGGGDYHGNNKELVGTWAGDSISMEKEVPEGYSELVVTFEED